MTSPAHSVSRLALLLVALVLVAAACDLGGVATTTTSTIAPTTTSTTEPLPELPPAPSTTTSLPPGVDPVLAEATAAEVTELMRLTQSLRALEFLERPRVQIVDEAAMRELVDGLALAPLGDPAFAIQQRVLDMLGMIPAGFSASALYVGYYEALPVAVFEAGTNTIHAIVRPAGFSALERSVVVRETVRALATEYFGTTVDTAGTVPVSIDDEALALAALVEGDATYFQLLYLQGLPDIEQEAAAFEARDVAWEPPGGTPRWLVERLAFPYDDGLVFVRRLVETGGIAALDRAYADPPVASEQVLHPERYLRGDSVRDKELVVQPPNGYVIHSEGRFGEMGLRALLSRSLDPGLLTQTVDGWIGDAYVAVAGITDAGIVIRMETSSEEDAIEVALGLIDHARETLGAGEGAEVDDGIRFDEGGPYVFIDRIETELVLVVATDSALGESLRRSS